MILESSLLYHQFDDRLGHLQPVGSLSLEGLLPDAFQPFGDDFDGLLRLNVSSFQEQSLDTDRV
jgi:hypothetical protein